MPKGKKLRSSNYSFLKLVIVLLLLFIVSMLTVFYIFPQIWVVISLKSDFPQSSYPQLYVIPKERQVEIVDTSFGNYKEYSSSGFRLKSPWSDEVSRANNPESEIFIFKDGKAIFFLKDRSILNPEVSRLAGSQEDLQRLLDFLGVDTLSSNYKFNESVLMTNPGTLSIFESRKEVLADSVLLSLKLALILPFKGGIYSFQTPSLRGFQYGDPAVSGGVKLQIFDKKDQEFHIGLKGATQKDIDFILSSIKFTN